MKSLTTATPGAARSTHAPELEKLAQLSDASVAATVIAWGARAGDALHASAPWLPAATTTVTPAADVRATAESRAATVSPLRLRFATAGTAGASCLCCATQSSAATTSDELPFPEQSSTRTATIRAPLATPYVAPPTVPATCVPCPWQSVAVPPDVTKSMPATARPPKSTCDWLTPVSMM